MEEHAKTPVLPSILSLPQALRHPKGSKPHNKPPSLGAVVFKHILMLKESVNITDKIRAIPLVMSFSKFSSEPEDAQCQVIGRLVSL